MSFHDITASQVVPPAVAERVSQQPEQRQKQKRRSRISSNVGSDAVDDSTALSRKIETATRLFEILSSRSDIDHPVCVECTEALVESMEKRLASTEKQRDAYIDFLKNAHADSPTPEEAQQVAKELVKCREKEAAAFRELEDLERQKFALEQEVEDLEREAKALDTEEAHFWQERNAFTTTLAEYQNERDSVELRYSHDTRLLERLQRTDVYTDTFSISYDGSFGTINGLRLGRLSGQPVEWAEINAAWGMALLFLDTLAEKLSFTFRGYGLHPLGSTSSIEKLPESATSSPAATRVITTSVGSASGSAGSESAKQQTEKVEHLPLHRGEHVPIVSSFIHRHFDQGMIAFLVCLRQLGKHVEQTTPSSGDSQVKMPYEIKKDKINDCSIKLGGFGQDENWTKACKHTLTYCKFLMAYTRDVKSTQESGG